MRLRHKARTSVRRDASRQRWIGTALGLLLGLAISVGVADAQQCSPWLINLSGNNYSINEPAAMGQELEIVGLLSTVQDNPPFAFPGISDWSTEYTFYMYDLILDSPPSDQVRNFTGGMVEIWSESPPDAPWTPTTPIGSIPAFNAADVPSKFTDGTLILKGDFTSFTILDFGGPTGTVLADLDFVAGANLTDLQNHPDGAIDKDWFWNGFFNRQVAVPPGYELLYGGKLERECVTPVESVTWGRVKALYAP